MLHLLILPDIIQRKRSLLLRPKALLSYIFLIIASIFFSSVIIYNSPDVLGYATNVNIKDLLKYSNARRQDASLENLRISSKLSKAAEAKAADMFAKDYWAHVSPSGEEPWDFIKGVGYKYLYAGENLAVDFADSQSVVTAWYNSPSHRENLLSSNYTEVGFAVVNGELQGRKTTLVVQMFGYPKTAAAVLSEKDIAVDTNTTDSEKDVVLDEATFDKLPSNNVTLNLTGVNRSVLNTADILRVSKAMAILLGFFIALLLVIDGYYARYNKVFRVSGHTILHILVLILAIAGIWYTNIGLVL